jgi:hypothetical protein
MAARHLSGQATFLGSLIGFLALLGGALGGALFNAWLNRRRDDRLRREEQRAVATALRAELAGCTKILLSDAELLNYSTSMPNFTIADLAHAIRIMPHVIPKLGLLDQETIEKASPGKDLKPAAV